MKTPKTITDRLEYLRGEIEAERISCEEIAELEGLAEHIELGDVLLLEWAGVPETTDKARYTPAPWEALDCTIWSASGEGSFPIAQTASHWADNKPGSSNAIECVNASRIVACVNACAGINPEAVPKILACLRTVRTECNNCRGDCSTCPLWQDDIPAAIQKATRKGE